MSAPLRVVLAAAILAAACGGGSPSAPVVTTTPPVITTPIPPVTPPVTPWAGANLTGIWSGPWTYTIDSLNATDQATVTFAANGATMDGRIATAAGIAGTISFATPSPLGGTLTLTVTLLTGGVCSGTGAMTGTLAGDELRVTAASLTGTTCPTWATNHLFILRK